MKLLKKESRILGIDDAPFTKKNDQRVLIIGTVFCGGQWMDGVITTYATVDGNDATEQISTMINQSHFKNNIFATLINGIAVGGFNVIDIEQLWKNTGIPVISITRRYPNFLAIYKALHNLGMEQKITLIKNAGTPEQIDRIYTQCKGIKPSEVHELIKLTCTRSSIPEPLRSAHIIAAGIVKGESKGRA